MPHQRASAAAATDLWELENWTRLFPHRAGLSAELALLDRLFPFLWRLEALREPTSRHQLRGDLATPGGCTRPLFLAAELLRLIGPSAGPQIPVVGRLRCWSLYQPTKSELLVAPILRSIGNVTWQPEGTHHGADYRVTDASRVYVAEVKRLCTSVRQERATMNRVLANMAGSAPVFTPDEQMANTREDARRLYPRVRHAAMQLAQSAGKAAQCSRRSAADVPGILFLDLDGNPQLVNVRESLHRWMRRPWARSIDLVLFFDFGCRNDAWDTIAEPIYSRNHRALDALFRALPICSRGHFHIGNIPVGACEFPLPL
jgi:hypothetical protein